MTLESLGNLGEFVGSLAVLITLIYLARQYHQSIAEKHTESLNVALGTHVHRIAQITATDEDSELFRRFCEDFFALSLNDRRPRVVGSVQTHDPRISEHQRVCND